MEVYYGFPDIIRIILSNKLADQVLDVFLSSAGERRFAIFRGVRSKVFEG
jgi:hypothetical protein